MIWIHSYPFRSDIRISFIVKRCVMFANCYIILGIQAQ